MANAIIPVSVGGIEFDALMDSSEAWESEIPAYPTEEGFSISDNVVIKPITLNMTLYLTNTPVTWKERHGVSMTRVQDVIRRLRELYFAKAPITVVTSETTYENMAIASIELSKTLESGTSREIPISFQEIRVVQSRTTTIPDSYGRSGATGTNAGTASTKSANAGASSDSTDQSNKERKGILESFVSDDFRKKHISANLAGLM